MVWTENGPKSTTLSTNDRGRVRLASRCGRFTVQGGMLRDEFPTRQVLARHLLHSPAVRAASLGLPQGEHAASGASAETVDVHAATDPFAPLVAMVLGIDAQPRRMRASEVAAFGDPFTRHVLLQGKVPLSLGDLTAAIDGLSGDGSRKIRKLYAVAEGAAFQASNPAVQVNTRLVFTWQRDSATPADILLSASRTLDDPGSLLQLIAWSETQGAYHFFERTGGAWAWAGNSFHALVGVSRGKGPFDSHINGGLVMKELKAPWIHWHSQAAGIDRAVLFPAASAGHPLFADLEGAEVLERTVRTGVRRWTRRRVQNDLHDGLLANLPWYARQILWTTSVNLVSADTLFSRLGDVEEFALPRTFFFDEDGISAAAARLDPTFDILPSSEPVIPSSLYQEAAAVLELRVEDREGGVSIRGDTNFAFAVPERAFEDLAVINELMAAGVLSSRLAMCLLMVDFSNPVFSPVRASLLDYFPESIGVGNDGAGLDAVLVAAIRASAGGATGAEREFLALWDDPGLLGTVRTRLLAFVEAIRVRLRSLEGALDLLRLAESRKEAFRGRKLNEFRHTTARSGVTIAHLAMREDATLFVKSADVGEKEK